MILFGKQVVLHILTHYPSVALEWYLSKEVDKALFARLRAHGREHGSTIVRVDSQKAQAMARGGNHQGFLAKVHPPKSSSLATLKHMNRILVLCGLTDVGNVGALFRSVACLGFEGVIMDTQLPYEGLARTSMGALYEVPFCVCPRLLDTVQELKDAGVYCYGAHIQGDDVRQVVFKHPLAIFLGSEGMGLTPKILRKMDRIVHIGMQSKVGSLNVSVAGAIMMDRAL
ncbi:TrmH family RNA methyltransferase [Helicobacter baculiformis]|uniref:OMP1475 n=1 Tax=Helicobacter baculiformis TaxID=427351 RepID=A0A1M4NHK8_9HELI|nr:TrmH family RNA methyltransferase [Helicobacter baculiformis]SFZ71456.1 OMP1475 [Helicobacter baculiformis]